MTPFLDDRAHGIFATRVTDPTERDRPVDRAARRVSGSTIEIEDVDMADGTPLLDIKPYVPAFDERGDVRVGWYAERLGGLADARADDRFQGTRIQLTNRSRGAVPFAAAGPSRTLRETDMKNPPILIAIIGFFAALAGFAFLFFGLRMVGFDWFGALGDLPAFDHVGLWGWLAVVTGIVWILAALGLWALQPWARFFALFMAGFALFEAILAFFQFPGTGVGFSMAILPALILWYLNSSEVKAAFAESEPAPVAAPPAAAPAVAAPVVAAPVVAAPVVAGARSCCGGDDSVHAGPCRSGGCGPSRRVDRRSTHAMSRTSKGSGPPRPRSLLLWVSRRLTTSSGPGRHTTLASGSPRPPASAAS